MIRRDGSRDGTIAGEANIRQAGRTAGLIVFVEVALAWGLLGAMGLVNSLVLLFIGCLIYCSNIYKQRQGALRLGRITPPLATMFIASTAFATLAAFLVRLVFGIIF